MFIYKTTNKINGKIYIGKLVRDSKTYLGSGKLLKMAIKKYGVSSFEREIIEYCDTKELLSEREKYWISYYDSKNKKIGYNITDGGDGGSTNSYFLGKKLSDEHRLNISKNHHNVSGENNPMFGKTHSDVSKEKISLKRKGIKHSEETIKLFKITRLGGNNNNSKLTESDVIQIRAESISGTPHNDLAKKFNVKKACIWKIVNRITWKHI